MVSISPDNPSEREKKKKTIVYVTGKIVQWKPGRSMMLVRGGKWVGSGQNDLSQTGASEV